MAENQNQVVIELVLDDGTVKKVFGRVVQEAKKAESEVSNSLGGKVFDTVIPRNVTLSEAPSFGKPVILYDLKSPGAQAYMALAREVISRG